MHTCVYAYVHGCVGVGVYMYIGQQISLDSDKPRARDTVGPKPFDGIPAVDELVPLVLLCVSMGMILHFKTLAAIGVLIVLANGAGAITVTSQLLALRQWIHQSPPVHRPIFSTIEHLPPPRVRRVALSHLSGLELDGASFSWHTCLTTDVCTCTHVSSGVRRYACGMRNGVGCGSILVGSLRPVGTSVAVFGQVASMPYHSSLLSSAFASE
jgi:hypothetical protein